MYWQASRSCNTRGSRAYGKCLRLTQASIRQESIRLSLWFSLKSDVAGAQSAGQGPRPIANKYHEGKMKKDFGKRGQLLKVKAQQCSPVSRTQLLRKSFVAPPQWTNLSERDPYGAPKRATSTSWAGEQCSQPLSLVTATYDTDGSKKDHSMPQRHVVRPRWRAYHWTGDTMSIVRCATHHPGQLGHPEMATFEQVVAALSSIF